ncbi:TraK domain-containing protein [Hydromonas duriensis]|uniref:TraK protein n=1 Tax=Hydromonas duriensis TaxID=1527608 RepID=A0A4R6Y680_9BURK|nr:type-F conjugative transfer system secretin TraK [Hydromonas duriensis]TDR30283.1 TraK protein [Hydromonas duriensis]
MFITIKRLAAAFVLCASLTAQAVQYVSSETENAHVDISKTDFTRLTIEGGRIQSIQTIKDELDSKKDEASNEWYILPKVNKPISVFVSSKAGKTYLLTLKPIAKSADSIVIRESVQDTQNLQRERREQLRAMERASESYMASQKRFMYALSHHAGSDDNELTCQINGENVPFWNEAMLIKRRTCSDGSLTGYEYTLTNISNAQMVLEEPEFFKKNVTAVAIERLVLAPDESTTVYVVSGVQP